MEDDQDGFGDFGDFNDEKAEEIGQESKAPVMDDDPFADILGEYGISDAKVEPVVDAFESIAEKKGEEKTMDTQNVLDLYSATIPENTEPVQAELLEAAAEIAPAQSMSQPFDNKVEEEK